LLAEVQTDIYLDFQSLSVKTIPFPERILLSQVEKLRLSGEFGTNRDIKRISAIHTVPFPWRMLNNEKIKER
jgi:hypothetical protein